MAFHLVSTGDKMRCHHRPHLAKSYEPDRHAPRLEIAKKAEKPPPHIVKTGFQDSIFRLKPRQFRRVIIRAVTGGAVGQIRLAGVIGLNGRGGTAIKDALMRRRGLAKPAQKDKEQSGIFHAGAS